MIMNDKVFVYSWYRIMRKNFFGESIKLEDRNIFKYMIQKKDERTHYLQVLAIGLVVV
jgi:hypothetical protein